MDELLEQFLIEGRELVEQASNDLVALERDPPRMLRCWTPSSAPFIPSRARLRCSTSRPWGKLCTPPKTCLARSAVKKVEADRAMIDALLECIDASERWIELIASTGNLPADAEQEAQALRPRWSRLWPAKICRRQLRRNQTGCWLSDLLANRPLAGLSAAAGPLPPYATTPTEDSFLKRR